MEKQDFEKLIYKPWYARAYLWQALAGVALLLCGIVVLVLLTGSVNGWQRTTAIVTDNTDGIVVSYTAQDGTTVQNVPLLYADRGWKVDRKVSARYRLDDPSVVQAYGHNAWLGACLLAAGVIVAALAGMGLADSRKRAKRLRAVAERGVAVEAQVVNVYNDLTGLSKRRRNAFCRLDCYYTPTPDRAVEGDGGVWIFTSERFANPHHRFTGTVTVYVTPDDPDNYYVDLQSLNVRDVEEDASPDAI